MQFFGAPPSISAKGAAVRNQWRPRRDNRRPGRPPRRCRVTGDFLDYDDVMAKFDTTMEWLARNLRTCDELHPLHARQILLRTSGRWRFTIAMSCERWHSEIAGLSVVSDSLSAIKYGKIRATRDAKTGLIVDYQNEGNKATPQFGNNDDRVDRIASDIVTSFMEKIRKHPTYRNATHTQSVLTITSNVVYGKATGNTPDGRPQGRAVRAWRKSDAWPGQPWLARLLPVGCQASLQGRARDGISLHRLHRSPKGAPVRRPACG